MNGFLQHYGLIIVGVLVTLIVIVFAFIYGGTITENIKAATDDFFNKSSIATEEPSDTQMVFTIDGESYQAEVGMTWGEWRDSEYFNELSNICSAEFSTETVFDKSGAPLVLNSTFVTFHNIIVPDGMYYYNSFN